jgi:hypothetical protein
LSMFLSLCRMYDIFRDLSHPITFISPAIDISVNQRINKYIYLHINISTTQSINESRRPYLSTFQSINQSIYLFIYLSIRPSNNSQLTYRHYDSVSQHHSLLTHWRKCRSCFNKGHAYWWPTSRLTSSNTHLHNWWTRPNDIHFQTQAYKLAKPLMTTRPMTRVGHEVS